MKPKKLMCILTISSLTSPIPKPDMYLALTFLVSRLINSGPLPKYHPSLLTPWLFSSVNDHQTTTTLCSSRSFRLQLLDHVFNRHGPTRKSVSIFLSTTHPNPEERAQIGPDVWCKTPFLTAVYMYVYMYA